MTTRADSPAASPAPPPPVTPAADAVPVIPGYTMLKVLGQGAMGTVWKAANAKTGELAAIKILVESLAKTPDFIWRFEREAEAMRLVHHPGVVRMVERGSAGGIHYIAMEFVDGEPIRREMERTRMPYARAVAISRRVARALHAAHLKGIVHRDLKPENVLLSRQGEVKIVDFGLAGLAAEVDPHPNLTRSHITMGTMNYMAPEQRTDAKRCTKHADIYSLGVMLYEMLTRGLPVGRYQLPVESGLLLPPGMDDLLRQALEYDKDKRQKDAKEFDDQLAKVEKQLNEGPTADESGKKRWWPFA